MKKFLFITIPSYKINDEKSNQSIWNEVVPPYGALSLISYVKGQGIDVEFKILDMSVLYLTNKFEEANNRLMNEVLMFEPDFIGLSAIFNSCYQNLGLVIDLIEQTSTNAKVLLGGGLATTRYKEILEAFKRIDLCILAEGEIPIANIILNDGDFTYENSQAIVTREKCIHHKIVEPEFIIDLDEIPLLDYSYIDINAYGNPKQVDLVSSRGCPYHCVFCASHLMNGKIIRYKSINMIDSELEKLSSLGFESYRFFDDNFFYKEERAKLILNKLISLNIHHLNVSFPSGVMAVKITDEIASLLKKAGVKSIPLAMESGSPYVLKKLMHKPVSLPLVEQSVSMLKKYDIDVQIFVVTGLPGETDQHREETTTFIHKIQPDWVSVNVATPLYGSELYDICIKNNYIKKYNDLDYSPKKAYIETEEYSSAYIEHISYKMNLDYNFVNNPNIKSGNYYKAKGYMDEIIKNHPTHAFAYYCRAICNKKLDADKNGQKDYDTFIRILSQNNFWQNYAREFKLLV